MKQQRTFSPRPELIERAWWLVDADGLPLGRLASEVAKVLRGKHKAMFSPHLDTGDFVIVVNAEKVAVTGTKEQGKAYYRHSGYPGGLRQQSLETVRQRSPERLVEEAVRGMLPRNRLGRSMFRKLKVYAGPDHPHGPQKPQPLPVNIRGVRS